MSQLSGAGGIKEISTNNKSSERANNASERNNNNNYIGSTARDRPQQPTTHHDSKGSMVSVADDQEGNKPRASGSQTRLSSIDILNENKQRQLQFKQQESFKQHLEQRQKFIQQQQNNETNTDSNLDVTYQVNTSAPDYMTSAVAKGAKQLESDRSASSVGIAVNPFDEDLHKRMGQLQRPTSAPGQTEPEKATADKNQASTVSGKSGFLSALMDEASCERLDEGAEELDSGAKSRYAKVAYEGATRYDYSDDPDRRPFYQKDLSTLIADCRASRKLVILIVAVALLLDNMLLTSVVPIIPAFLYKLRIESQHRELLLSNSSSYFPARTGASGYDDQAGSPAETKFEAELERRINQSLANVKDRFSGSFFHPRVRSDLKQLDNGPDSRLEQSSPQQQPQTGSAGRKQPVQPTNGQSDDDGDDDDYEDNEPESGDSSSPTTTRALFEASTKSNKPVRKTQLQAGKSWHTNAPPDAASLDDDADDEDLVDAQRWTRLRSSIASMASGLGNDTDALGSVCLLMVNEPTRYLDNTKEDNKARAEDQTKSWRMKTMDKGEQKGANSRRPKRSVRTFKARARSTTTTTPEPSSSTLTYVDQIPISHQDIVDESFEVGVMFASKPIVQAFANPFIGSLTNRIGFTIPMFFGFIIMFLSTLVFAFGNSYSTLFVARAIQGVGSACSSVAGMSMLAERFPDDAERGNAMAIALGGLALGVVIGPPFGGFMYEFVGRSSPFIVLSVLCLLDGLLQLLMLQPRVTKSREEGASLITLIKDPYILVAAGAITFANTGIAILEPALPLWMMDTMQAKNWEQGVAFLPAALSYMFGTNIFGSIGHRIGRWRSSMIGLIIIGCSLLLIPFATRVEHLIVPNGAIGFAMGMVDSTMMPMLGYLVDIRHTSVYGSVYAIGDVAFCASFAFGPALSGTLVELVGFEGLIITTALICFCFAPLLFLLKSPPAKAFNEAQLQEKSTLRYVNYNHLDSPDEDAQLNSLKPAPKTYVR